jgi:hypothetical protein
MAKQRYSVNFLRGQRGQFLDKFINWALTVGRLLVIITETAALSAFAYRLTIDWQIIDLNDKIKQQQAFVSLLQSNEEKYRNLQARIAQAKTLGSKNEQMLTIFQNIYRMATGKVTFSNMTVSETSVKMDATAKTPDRLNRFIGEVKAYDAVQSVSLSKIENNTVTREINVTILVILKTQS